MSESRDGSIDFILSSMFILSLFFFSISKIDRMISQQIKFVRGLSVTNPQELAATAEQPVDRRLDRHSLRALPISR